MRILPVMAVLTLLATGICSALELPKHNFEAATEFYYFKYREPDVMKESGMMYGLAGNYAYHNKLMLKAEGRGAWGQVDYKNSGKINNINDWNLEFRGMGGYDFKLAESFILTPYFGVGYRYLNDDISGKTSTTNAAGYERESNYFYSPVGVEGTFSKWQGWKLGFSAEYDIFWRGWQKSHLSDANKNYGDLSNTQDSGYGVRGSLKLQKTGEVIDIIVEPFIRYWQIDRSKDTDVRYAGVIIGYGYEPKNNTTESGVKVGVKF